MRKRLSDLPKDRISTEVIFDNENKMPKGEHRLYHAWIFNRTCFSDKLTDNWQKIIISRSYWNRISFVLIMHYKETEGDKLGPYITGILKPKLRILGVQQLIPERQRGT